MCLGKKSYNTNKKTGDILLSFTKDTNTLLQQNRTKPQEILEIKIAKPIESFPSIIHLK